MRKLRGRRPLSRGSFAGRRRLCQSVVMQQGPHPSRRRTLIGLIVAPMIAALPLALLNHGGQMEDFVHAVALVYAHAGLSSLPLLLWLRHRRVAASLRNCVIGGAGSFALPLFLAGFVYGGFFILAVVLAAPVGALAGGAFWVIACRDVPDVRHGAADAEQDAE